MERNNMYQEKIFNISTGEETIRKYTPEEIAKVEAEQEIIAQRLADIEAKRQVDAVAKAAILAKLGITEEEAKLLLS
jgi:RNase H-fold protein (predicted Holliday junction resolvase)